MSHQRQICNLQTGQVLRKIRKMESVSDLKGFEGIPYPFRCNSSKSTMKENAETMDQEKKQGSKRVLDSQRAKVEHRMNKKNLRFLPYPYPQEESQVISSSFSFVFSIFKRNLRKMQEEFSNDKQNLSSSQASRSGTSPIHPSSHHQFHEEESYQIQSLSSNPSSSSKKGQIKSYNLCIPDQFPNQLYDQSAPEKYKISKQGKNISDFHENDISGKSKDTENVEQQAISTISGDKYIYLEDFLYANARYRLSIPSVITQISQIRQKLNKPKTYEGDKRARICQKVPFSTKEDISELKKMKFDDMMRRMAQSID